MRHKLRAQTDAEILLDTVSNASYAIESEQCYFVDDSKDFSGNGRSWETAFVTIAEAIAACDNDYSDNADFRVFIAPGDYEEDDLLFAGHGLHLIGLGNPGMDSGVHIKGAAEAAYCVLGIAGANCTVKNIALEAAGAEPCLYLPAADNCVFDNIVLKGVSATTEYAIEMDDTRGTKFKNLQFGAGGAGFKTALIYAEGGADQYMIHSTIENCNMWSTNTGVKGLLIDVDCVTYANVVKNNAINLVGAGSTAIGIDNNSTGNNLFVGNYVVVDTSAVPIESASTITGILGNHTMAGSTVVDPNTVAT